MMTVCPICGKYTCIHWPEHWIYKRGSTYYCSETCLQTDLHRDMHMMNQVMKKRRGMKLMSQKITLEMKKKAVEIAVSGESPLEYLKKCGSRKPNVLWYTIKENLKKVDPETYAKIPDFRQKPKTAAEAMANMKDAADTFFSQCDEMGLNLGKDEPEATPPTVKLTGPIRIETPEGSQVHVVEVPEKKPDDEIKKPLERIVGPCHIDKFLITAVKHPELGEFYWDKKYSSLDWRTEEGDEISMTPAQWQNLLKDLPHVLRILGVK